MEIFAFLFICIFLLCVAVWVIRIPVRIAESRGLTNTQISIVAVLSWCGIFFGVTWTVALILSLVWENDGPSDEKRSIDPDKLLKLNELREKGVISQAEFDEQKKLMMEE